MLLSDEKKQIKVGTDLLLTSEGKIWRVTKQIDDKHFEIQRLSSKGKPLVRTLSLDKTANYAFPINEYEFETTIRIRVTAPSEERARTYLPSKFYDDDECCYEVDEYQLITKKEY